jgi:hypothetical protein
MDTTGWVFPAEVTVEVQWPGVYKYNGIDVYATGKTGESVKTKLPSAEYEDDEGNRYWLDVMGNVTED